MSFIPKVGKQGLHYSMDSKGGDVLAKKCIRGCRRSLKSRWCWRMEGRRVGLKNGGGVLVEGALSSPGSFCHCLKSQTAKNFLQG